MLSFWEKKYYFGSSDFAIIGAGYTGLSAAYHLKKKFPKKKISVFEKGKMPSGASTKNAGFACFGSLSEILSDIKGQSENDAFTLIEERHKGLQKIQDLIGKEQIDLKYNGGFELFRDQDLKLFENCRENIDYVNSCLKGIIGESVYEIQEPIRNKFGFNGFNNVIFNQYEGQLNPVKLVKALIKLCNEIGVEIHFNTEVSNIEEQNNGYKLKTQIGLDIFTNRLILATNGFSNKFIEFDIQPARAQVLITKPLNKLSFDSCFHFDEGFYYFRSLDNRVLFGGGRNLDFETEKTSDMNVNPLIQENLIKILRNQILPNQSFDIEQHWVGIMGIGQSKKPIVSKINEHLYCATRLGGMGVAIGIATGEKLAKIVD